MLIFKLNLINEGKLFYQNLNRNVILSRYLCSVTGCHHLNEKEITSETKQTIEKHWRSVVAKASFNAKSNKPKKYVLSMFPYPSGFLHMGHVRVYTISDAMARFYKMNNMNVLHPMGWDAFGLPAENAAIQRKIPADVWTKQNIEHMRIQLKDLGCAFDWNREYATCDPEYYKWTQKLFLMLYKDGLAYQKEALVNWDPVDQTVLADEQVDDNGCSWRSGAKVEKKLLKQWFIKTTRFAKPLLEGLDDPILEDWKDIIKLQKHWIGDCDGYAFELNVDGTEDKINVWTKDPTDLCDIDFIALSPEHVLTNRMHLLEGLTELRVKNPFTQKYIPVLVTEKLNFPEQCDSYIGVCVNIPEDAEIATKYNVPVSKKSTEKQISSEEIIALAQKLNIGGHQVSSKLKDWLISRQRFWGTPIPIINCDNCGVVPVPDSDLPVELPVDVKEFVGKPLSQNHKWLHTTCPSCGNKNAQRETDTMDTFVDSSWYFLRFLDSKNHKEAFDKEIVKKFMPVDLYVGGKEHAVLHLYYARFFNHFLHSKGLVPNSEPFKRLLVQGMVNGQTFRVKGSGKYLKEDEVEIIDTKKGKAVEKTTGNPVVMDWEKMSKSKFNGVDPADVIKEHGCDTLRLIMLADVAPTSTRNWSSGTFPGILYWQNRIWMTTNDFLKIKRNKEPKSLENEIEFKEHEQRLFDARNYFITGTTFNYRHSHQLSVAISKMQGLTNALRKTPSHIIPHSIQYERALAALLIMISPMAPHFALELWSRLVTAPNRKTETCSEINWKGNVLQQQWPEVDSEYGLTVQIRINGIDSEVYRYPRSEFDNLQHEDIFPRAMNDENIVKIISQYGVKQTSLELYPGCHAFFHIHLTTGLKTVKDKKGKRKIIMQ